MTAIAATQIDQNRGNATMSSTLYCLDESMVRSRERAEASFLETIVGRRGANERHRLDHRRNWDGQGGHRARDSRAQPAPQPESRQNELCGDAGRPSRKRAL